MWRFVIKWIPVENLHWTVHHKSISKIPKIEKIVTKIENIENIIKIEKIDTLVKILKILIISSLLDMYDFFMRVHDKLSHWYLVLNSSQYRTFLVMGTGSPTSLHVKVFVK